ncbi:hypothetical protein EPKpNR5154_50280 [Klebsiella pneumoniae]
MLLVAPQAQAATRQVGIDIPVQWYADASGQMTIDRFAALPTDQLATTRQIPSFGYSRKTWWLRSELPGTWFAGEPRWLQLGPSFVDHLTIYYRPLGSDAPLGTAHLWRPRRRPRERPALPRKRADPPPAADRRRL